MNKKIKKKIAIFLIVALVFNACGTFADAVDFFDDVEVNKSYESSSSDVHEDVMEEIVDGTASEVYESVESEDTEEIIDNGYPEEPEDDLATPADAEEVVEDTKELEAEASTPSEIEEIKTDSIEEMFLCSSVPATPCEIIMASESTVATKLFGAPSSTVYWFYSPGDPYDVALKSDSTVPAGYTYGGVYNDSSSITAPTPGMSLQKIIILNDIYPASLANYFKGFSALESIQNINRLHTDDVTDMSYMFYQTGLISLDLSSFNTSSASNMERMFDECYSLSSLNLTSFDTSNVTNMIAMFRYTGFKYLDITSFDTSKVQKMSYMFQNNSSLESLFASEKFVTTSVTDGGAFMFDSCRALKGGYGNTLASMSGSPWLEFAKIDTSTTKGLFSTIKTYIGTRPYGSLQSAIDYVNNGQTIRVVDDIEEIDETKKMAINNGKTFTIDFKEGSKNHIFYYNILTTPYSYNVPVLEIGGNTKLTINNMDYRIATRSIPNVSYVNNIILIATGSNASLVLNNFTNENEDSLKQDKIIVNNGASVSINGGYFKTSALDTFTLLNSGTYTLNGDIVTSIPYTSGCVVMIDGTSTNKNNSIVNINGGSYEAAALVGLRGNAKVNVTGGNFYGTYGTILELGTADDCEIVVSNLTSNTFKDRSSGSGYGIVAGSVKPKNKIIIKSGNYLYEDGRLSFDIDSNVTSTNSVIYGGKFGPIGTVSDANYKEIVALLAPNKKVVEITNVTDRAKGYYYEVVDATPIPTPTPYRPSSGGSLGGSSGGAGRPIYDNNKNIVKPGDLNNEFNIPTTILDYTKDEKTTIKLSEDIAYWEYEVLLNKYKLHDKRKSDEIIKNKFCELERKEIKVVNEMQVVENVIDLYCFDNNGYLITGWVKDKNNFWYFFDTDAKNYGRAVKNAWKMINGTFYYFMENGIWWDNSLNSNVIIAK